MARLVLGIETSCDETAAAVVSADGRILSNIVASQVDEHQRHGGVVPSGGTRTSWPDRRGDQPGP